MSNFVLVNKVNGSKVSAVRNVLYWIVILLISALVVTKNFLLKILDVNHLILNKIVSILEVFGTKDSIVIPHI